MATDLHDLSIAELSRLIAERRRDHGLHHEPANVFSFPAAGLSEDHP